MDVTTTIVSVLAGALAGLVSFLPRLLAGLVLLLVGLLVASALRALVDKFFQFLPVDKWWAQVTGWFESLRVESKTRAVWSDILAELVRWAVIILFLIPAAEAWGLPRITDVLNSVLLYLPNVFVAVVVGFVGIAISNVVFRLVRSATMEIGLNSANLLGNVGRYALVFFTALVVLNQLGVASDLVRILFTGIVAMLALAGGIAFGLGGQETARGTLKDLSRRLSGSEVAATEVRVQRTAVRRTVKRAGGRR